MFNLKAIATAFNFTPVAAGSFETKEGFVLTLRPKFDAQYLDVDALTTFVDAQDLFNSSMSYYERKLTYVATKEITAFVTRLEAKKECETTYSLNELLEFVTKYEDRNPVTLNTVYFYSEVRSNLIAEFERLGIEEGGLVWLYSVAEELLHFFNDYNS